jgi:hypothetical protein
MDITWTLRSEIGNFMTFHFLMALVVFALVAVYFPSSPEIPPENAKTIPRLKPMDGLRVVLRYFLAFPLVIHYWSSSGTETCFIYCW